MIRGLWTRETIGWIIVAAMLPVAAMLIVAQGGPGAVRLLSAFIAAAFWTGLFRAWHGVPLSPTPVVLAVAVALLAPVGLTPLQIGLGTTFGIVLAELVFGGWGRNVIGAAPVALAMLYLTHPGATPPPSDGSMAMAAGAAGLILLVAGIAPAAVLAGAAAGLAAVTAGLGLPLAPLIGAGGLVFGLAVLLADPVASPTTPAARVVYGAAAGALAALLAGTGGLAGAGHAIVFSVLLAQIFASAFDHAALALIRISRTRRRA